MNTELAHLFLTHTQGSDGAWSYQPAGNASVEPTATALLALRGVPDSSAVERGLTWLKNSQHADGGWGLSPVDPESSWHTAWGLLAHALIAPKSESVGTAASWLLGVALREVTTEEGVLDEDRFGMDLSLRGWPWRANEATWVEPTALSLLALTTAEISAEHPRMQEAVRYLLDRRGDSGGWNVGNPRMFSQSLPARAVPSAWALLALCRQDTELVTPADLSALKEDAAQDGGPLALAWTLLALRSMGQDNMHLARQLDVQQQANGSWEASPYYTAVALLAARGQL